MVNDEEVLSLECRLCRGPTVIQRNIVGSIRPLPKRLISRFFNPCAFGVPSPSTMASDAASVTSTDVIHTLEHVAPVWSGAIDISHSSSGIPEIPGSPFLPLNSTHRRVFVFIGEGIFTFSLSFVKSILIPLLEDPSSLTESESNDSSLFPLSLILTEYLTPSEIVSRQHRRETHSPLDDCLSNILSIQQSLLPFPQISPVTFRFGVDATACRFGLLLEDDEPSPTSLFHLPRHSCLYASGIYAVREDPTQKGVNSIELTRNLMTRIMMNSSTLQLDQDRFYLVFGLSIKETSMQYRVNFSSDQEWENGVLQWGWNVDVESESTLDGRKCFLRLIMYAPKQWLHLYSPRRCGDLSSSSDGSSSKKFYKHCQTASTSPVGNCRDFVVELIRSDSSSTQETNERFRRLCCMVHGAYCGSFWRRERNLRGKRARMRMDAQDDRIRQANRLVEENSGLEILKDSIRVKMMSDSDNDDELLKFEFSHEIWRLRSELLFGV